MRILALALLLIAPALDAATYAARDLHLPIVGRAAGAGGRMFTTSLSLTNSSSNEATVTLTFLKASQPNPAPRATQLVLHPGETRTIADVGPDILGAPDATGALRITSTQNLSATARIGTRLAHEPASAAQTASFRAIPSRYAVGNGDTTTIPGVSFNNARSKLYVVETVGHPLYFSISLLDDSTRVVAAKRLYVAAREARSYDLAAELATTTAGTLRIEGINGDGRLIAIGNRIPNDTQTSTLFEMTLSDIPRHRIPRAELAAYLAMALVIVAAWGTTGGLRRPGPRGPGPLWLAKPPRELHGEQQRKWARRLGQPMGSGAWAPAAGGPPSSSKR